MSDLDANIEKAEGYLYAIDRHAPEYPLAQVLLARHEHKQGNVEFATGRLWI